MWHDEGRQPVKGLKMLWDRVSGDITRYDVIFPRLRRLLESFRHTLEIVKILSPNLGKWEGEHCCRYPLNKLLRDQLSNIRRWSNFAFRHTNLNDPLQMHLRYFFFFFLLRSIDCCNDFCRNNNIFFFLGGKRA